MIRKDLDMFDRRILAVLQKDATSELHVIADHAKLSPTACWRRIKKLQEAGVIVKRVTLLSAEALGLGLVGFVTIRTSDHSESWTEEFERKVSAMDSVIEFHRMTGDVDYILKIVAGDLAAYDDIYRRLIRMPGLTDVCASFSMDPIKVTTALPLVA